MATNENCKRIWMKWSENKHGNNELNDKENTKIK